MLFRSGAGFVRRGLKAMTSALASWRVPPVSETERQGREKEWPGGWVANGLVPGPVLGWLGQLALFFLSKAFSLFFSLFSFITSEIMLQIK